jgi:hypothetical protein
VANEEHAPARVRAAADVQSGFAKAIVPRWRDIATGTAAAPLRSVGGRPEYLTALYAQRNCSAVPGIQEGTSAALDVADEAATTSPGATCPRAITDT